MIAELLQGQPNREQVEDAFPKNPAIEKTRIDRISPMLVCLDGANVSSNVIRYAQTLASALQADLQLLTVLELDHDTQAPFDPVEWSLRRINASRYLEGLVAKNHLDPIKTALTVLEGESATAISSYLSGTCNEVTVFCRKDEQETGHIGSTSRCVLERCAGSVFLIPACSAKKASIQIDRIMVPLDGSARAESVLPTIRNIAQACNAIVVLVHAEPRTDIAEKMPGDRETAKLKAALSKHNRSAAQRYLDRISRSLSQSGVDVVSRVVTGGDSRRQLIETVTSESIDLVVLSSHGVSGHTDVPFGDIAGHMLSRSPVPILMLRDKSVAGDVTVVDRYSESAARAPEGAESP